ncbi:MAG: ATP-binding cassette domain-containing protein, partial [Planctomycetes bacterium]|nr:ATP-binding cassette domain-containing protein [Planctomycetota bacterium]
DSGSIFFDKKNVTDTPVHERALAGISRTFQITSVFNNLSVRQNMNLAVQATLGHSFSFWRPAGSLPGLKEQVQRFLAMTGLEHRAATAADALSHGEKRQLAIAMVLAARPKLLLMDEPAAGMGRHESDKIITLLDAIRADHGILLVEHDMDLVFAVADRISVLVYGKIIATGSPGEIRNNPAVNEAYLGDTHA